LEGRRLAGDPVTVADPVALDQSLFVGAFSVSATGLVAYRLGVARRQLVWFDRSGKAQGALAAPDNNGLTGAQLAPDGRRAATFRTVEGNTDIWLLDAARRTRLTSDASRDVFPVWSPDGSRLAFDSNRRGHRDLYITSANKANSEELLVESGQDKSVADWSPDGRFLLYHSIDPETSWDLWVLPMDGDRTPVAWLKTRITERSAKISPDGRWVAYISDESGQREVYVRPFSGTLSEAASEKWPVSTAGGAWPRWRADGRELYYLAPDDRLMAVPVAATGRMFEVGVPVALFRPRIYGGGTNQNVGSNYDVSDDGRFLINTVLDDEVPITILQNWDPERQR
jgi:dipeptidyl aminopeptidase/acylaminoacyl peptidase